MRLMNWFRHGLAPWKPVHTLLFADKKVFFWIKDKLGLSDYQMAALLWLKGLVTGVLIKGLESDCYRSVANRLVLVFGCFELRLRLGC